MPRLTQSSGIWEHHRVEEPREKQLLKKTEVFLPSGLREAIVLYRNKSPSFYSGAASTGGFLFCAAHYFSEFHVNLQLITRTDEENNKGERARKGKQSNIVSYCLCPISEYKINEYKILF